MFTGHRRPLTRRVPLYVRLPDQLQSVVVGLCAHGPLERRSGVWKAWWPLSVLSKVEAVTPPAPVLIGCERCHRWTPARPPFQERTTIAVSPVSLLRVTAEDSASGKGTDLA